MTGPLALALALAVAALALACAAPERASDGAPPDAAGRAAAEVVELHRFFEDWFAARRPDTAEGIAPLERALAEGFVHIGPGGRRTERAELVATLRAAHGAHVDDGFAIRIADVRARELAGGYVVATYEEWQESRDAPARGRISTVLFRSSADRPNGLVWVQVHETWLP